MNSKLVQGILKPIRKKNGIAFITVLLLLAVTSALGLAFLQKATIGRAAVAVRSDALQARYLAESAANHALWRLIHEADFPSAATRYTMHSMGGGRYGYKVRRHTSTTFATIATVGALGEQVVHQSYVLDIQGGWYDPDWPFRQKITLSEDVTDADLTDFPYMIKITDASNPLFMNGQLDGEDILFTDSTNTIKLDHEIEKYDGLDGTEELVAWVKIPLLSSTDPTVICMYYGNSGVTSQENQAGVWSNGYEAVYHLNDDFDDALGNHDGTNHDSTDVQGQIADAQDFYPGNGVDYIDLDNWNVSGNGLTLQAWLKSDDSFAQTWPRAICKANGDATQEQNNVWLMSLAPGTSNHNRLRFMLKTGTSDGFGTISLDGANPNGYLEDPGDWYLVAMTYNGTQMQIIKNGLNGGTTAKGGNLRENNWTVEIGNHPGSTDANWTSWDGKLDEVRVSSVARSLDWMMAEYRNQGSPGTYETFENEEEYELGGTVVLEADFKNNTDGFTYSDDTFRSTSQPAYASGNLANNDGYTDDALRVFLGGINNNTVYGMSGGWQKTFELTSTNTVYISFLYKMTLASEFEPDEYGQVLVSVDGTLYGEGSDDVVAQINGDGNGGNPDISGWHRFRIKLEGLSAGSHTLAVGVYGNKKTYIDETIEILIDDVLIRQ